MPTFIKKRTTNDPDRNRINFNDHSLDELVSLYKEHRSRFIEVTESHAADVLRPQGKYQEVNTNELEQLLKAQSSGEGSDARRNERGRQVRSSKRPQRKQRSNGNGAAKA